MWLSARAVLRSRLCWVSGPGRIAVGRDSPRCACDWCLLSCVWDAEDRRLPELPVAAKDRRETPKAAGAAYNCRGTQRDTEDCRVLPRTAEGHRGLPRVAEGCWGPPRSVGRSRVSWGVSMSR